jgi:Uncharacterised nucleotidyltransferase
MNRIDHLLVSAVRDPASPLPPPPADRLGHLERHHLAPLAWDALATSGRVEDWPRPVQSSLRRASAAQALVSDLLDRELRRVIDSAGEAGVRTLLIKGAALAYTHYRRPHLRPRSDSDIVVNESDRDAMARVLDALGYRRSDAIDGSLITQQAQWTRTLDAGVVHAVDVHWRVFNPHLFGPVAAVDWLYERACPLPALGPHAHCPCTVDALLLACVHRVAHHAGEDDPIWDFDVHLLVSSLSDDDAAEFGRIVAAADLRAISAAGIGSAHSRFRTRLPSAVLSLVRDAEGHREPTAVFLEQGRRQVDVLTSDLAALGSWRARASLLRQHLFPSPAYMRAKYGVRSAALLPFAYARRIVAGVPRWFSSQRS